MTNEFFPFSPDYSSWEDYNGNLIIFFGEEPIGAHPETEWKLTARQMYGLPTFLKYPIPDPDVYDRWQDWANDFTQILNGPNS